MLAAACAVLAADYAGAGGGLCRCWRRIMQVLAADYAGAGGGLCRCWRRLGEPVTMRSSAADVSTAMSAAAPWRGQRKVVSNRGMPDKRARHRAGTDWDRRLSAGFACRGLDAPGARSAAWEPGGCPCRAAGRTTAHVASYRLRRCRRGIEPRRRRAGWKAGAPSQPRRRRAGWKAGAPSQPRRRRAGWKAGAPGQPRRRRAGWKAGAPSQPRRRRAGWKAGAPSQPRRRRAGCSALGPFACQRRLVVKLDSSANIRRPQAT